MPDDAHGCSGDRLLRSGKTCVTTDEPSYKDLQMVMVRGINNAGWRSRSSKKIQYLWQAPFNLQIWWTTSNWVKKAAVKVRDNFGLWPPLDRLYSNIIESPVPKYSVHFLRTNAQCSSTLKNVKSWCSCSFFMVGRSLGAWRTQFLHRIIHTKLNLGGHVFHQTLKWTPRGSKFRVEWYPSGNAPQAYRSPSKNLKCNTNKAYF